MFVAGSVVLVGVAFFLILIALLRGYKPFAGPARGADLVGAPAIAIRTLEVERAESVRSMDPTNMALLAGSISCFIAALILAVL